MITNYNKFLNENKNENIIDSIIESNIFNYNVGSSNQQIKNPNRNDIKDAINEIITHNFFDWDFYLNEANSDESYKKAFETELKPTLLNDIEKFFSQWMVISWETKYYKRNYNTWEINRDRKEDIRKIIDKHINTSKIITPELRYKYNLHRWVYAGEKPDIVNFDYIGDFPNQTIKMKK